MAASITHLVVGERVFPQISHLDSSAAVYGAFLAGCTIVDVHAFHAIDRRETHFVGRLDTDGEDAYRKSCSNFLKELGSILKNDWSAMTKAERAFVMGYLCHLAVDECWKELGWQWFQKLNITSYKDFPVHPDVMLTAFDCLSRDQLLDAPTVFAALATVQIPDVFGHVPHEMLCRQWDILQGYLQSQATPKAYVGMLQYAHRFREEDQAILDRRFAVWDQAIQLIESVGGAIPFLQGAVTHSLEIISDLAQIYP